VRCLAAAESFSLVPDLRASTRVAGSQAIWRMAVIRKDSVELSVPHKTAALSFIQP